MLDLLSNEAMLLTVAGDRSISEDGVLKIKTIGRVKRLLQREKHNYIRVLHARCGIGLTAEEFNTIVLGLIEQNWCYLREGDKGGVIVVFNEAFVNVTVPEVA
jgi:hypothetical protein